MPIFNIPNTPQVPPVVRKLDENPIYAGRLAGNLMMEVTAPPALINPAQGTIDSLKETGSVRILKHGSGRHRYMLFMAELLGFYQTLEIHPEDDTRLKVWAIIKTYDREDPFIIDTSEFSEDKQIKTMPTDEQLEKAVLRCYKLTPQERREIFEWGAKRHLLSIEDFSGTKFKVDINAFKTRYFVGQIIEDTSQIPYLRKNGN